MKKRVSSSNLALRFYKCDGWTQGCLHKYLVKGKILDTEFTHADDPKWAYFILDVGSKLNMIKLYDNEVSEVYRAFDDNLNMTDLEFMESKNW